MHNLSNNLPKTIYVLYNLAYFSQIGSTAIGPLERWNNTMFSTIDSDNTVNGTKCAERFGPWWHHSNCSDVTLNNDYMPSSGLGMMYLPLTNGLPQGLSK